MNKKIEFQEMNWEQIAQGAEQKLYRTGNKIIRLLRLKDDFIDAHWCTKGHIGYVLKGEMSIDFNENQIEYLVGDAFIINAGNFDKHKAIIKPGKLVELLLIE